MIKDILKDDSSLRVTVKNKEPALANASFDIFDGHSYYLVHIKVYFAYFGKLPSILDMGDLKLAKVREWLKSVTSFKILKNHFRGGYKKNKRDFRRGESIYILEDEMLLSLSSGTATLYFQSEHEEDAKRMLLEIHKKFADRKKDLNNIYMVVDRHGLELADLKNRKPKLNVQQCYNDDFTELHTTIVKQLKAKNRSGLHLFYGSPGTGKSTYIRYLVSLVGKKIIFMPTNLSHRIDSPELVDILLFNQNAVLIIEDAENLLQSREKGNNSSISTLLNLTDGILGESLSIQIICTFNTHLSNIDKALLRKGRLLSMYEFKELAPDKANALLKSNGSDIVTTEPMSLADIYKVEELDFDAEPGGKRVGFRG